MHPWLTRLLVVSIKVYQSVLSPDHSWLAMFMRQRVCRFEPTCSEYMRQAIERYGWRGVWLGLVRLWHCHPGNPGGLDPLPLVVGVANNKNTSL